MWKYDVNIHVSGDTLSDPIFVKAFDRDKYLFNHSSKYGVGRLIAREIKEKYHNICGIHSSSRGTVHDDSRWLVMTPKFSTEILNFCRHPWVKIYRYLRQYLTYGGHIGLYVCLQDTADATRTFLSRITPSRAVFRAILVPRDPWDNSEMIVRAWSLVTRLLTQTDFLTLDVTFEP